MEYTVVIAALSMFSTCKLQSRCEFKPLLLERLTAVAMPTKSQRISSGATGFLHLRGREGHKK